MTQGTRATTSNPVPRIQKSLKISHVKSMIVLGLILFMGYLLTKSSEAPLVPTYKVRSITLVS